MLTRRSFVPVSRGALPPHHTTTPPHAHAATHAPRPQPWPLPHPNPHPTHPQGAQGQADRAHSGAVGGERCGAGHPGRLQGGRASSCGRVQLQLLQGPGEPGGNPLHFWAAARGARHSRQGSSPPPRSGMLACAAPAPHPTPHPTPTAFPAAAARYGEARGAGQSGGPAGVLPLGAGEQQSRMQGFRKSMAPVYACSGTAMLPA